MDFNKLNYLLGFIFPSAAAEHVFQFIFKKILASFVNFNINILIVKSILR